MHFLKQLFWYIISNLLVEDRHIQTDQDIPIDLDIYPVKQNHTWIELESENSRRKKHMLSKVCSEIKIPVCSILNFGEKQKGCQKDIGKL